MTHSPYNPHRAQRRRGVVLVVVTVVILLISLAAYGFVTMMQTENKAAFARGDQLQAQAVAASGREYLAAMLELPRGERPTSGELGGTSDLFSAILVDGDLDDPEDARQGRFSVIVPTTSAEMGDRAWQFGYVNESSKLSLTLLLEIERRSPGAGRDALMNLPDMDESTADAILDWVDPDDRQRDQGAESEFYSGLTPPLRPRNSVPPTLEELLLVRGVTREKLFGIDLNANFQIDASEQQLAQAQAGSATELAAPWSHFLTVHSGERDEDVDGRPRVCLNQADLANLHRELSTVFDASWANYIVAYRQHGPYKGSGKRREAEELPVDFSRPATRRIRSPLELINTRVAILPERRAETGGKGSVKKVKEKKGKSRGKSKQKVEVFVSPFTSEPSHMREYLPKLMDAVTVGTGSPLRGRVNVDLAPPEVLSALPGIDMALADRIVSARSMSSSDTVAQQHPVWLLVEGIVSRGTMLRLDQYVTTGGDVGRAQIIGYYDHRSPIMRFETVVDGTYQPARQVYYKDLRRLGRGVADELIGLDEL